MTSAQLLRHAEVRVVRRLSLKLSFLPWTFVQEGRRLYHVLKCYRMEKLNLTVLSGCAPEPVSDRGYTVSYCIWDRFLPSTGAHYIPIHYDKRTPFGQLHCRLEE
jgi:hypothetical protein